MIETLDEYLGKQGSLCNQNSLLFLIATQRSHCTSSYEQPLRPVIRIKPVGKETSVVLLLAEFIQLLNLTWSKLERRHSEVVRQSLLLPARSDGNDVLINAPSQRNLTGAHGVLFGQSSHVIINRAWARFRDCAQGAIRFSRNAVLLVELKKLGVLEVRVEFDLVASRDDLGGLKNSLQVLGQEVGNTD